MRGDGEGMGRGEREGRKKRGRRGSEEGVRKKGRGRSIGCTHVGVHLGGQPLKLVCLSNYL